MKRNYKFISKPEEKVTICIKETGYSDIVEEVESHCSELTRFIIRNLSYIDPCSPYIIQHGKTYKGVARCMEEDEFDEETGKKLAKLNADIKQRMKISSKYNRIIFGLENTIDELRQLMESHEEKIDELLAKKERIGGEV